jgi:hypothetical protein
MLLTGNSVVEMNRPAAVHIANADRMALVGSFCNIIGIASIIPAIMPRIIPLFILLFICSGSYIILTMPEWNGLSSRTSCFSDWEFLFRAISEIRTFAGLESRAIHF